MACSLGLSSTIRPITDWGAGAFTLLSIYADSGALMSLCLTDAHSQEAQRRMAQRPRIWLTPLYRVEWPTL
jgi:hypothetical protein